MGFEPTIILRKNQLEKAIPTLEKEQHSFDENGKVAKYLIEVSKYESIKFNEIELIICNPELSNFNRLVRGKLYDLNIDFQID